MWQRLKAITEQKEYDAYHVVLQENVPSPYLVVLLRSDEQHPHGEGASESCDLGDEEE